MIIVEIVIVGFFSAIYTGSAALPALVPKSVIAQVGAHARFNCTTVHNEPVYWTTRPYGSSATNDIYIGERFLLDDYGTSGRFSVEVGDTLKRYDLVIKDIRQSDAGVYICIDERGLGKKAYAELIVWDTLTCQLDQRKDSYMGENVFDLYQDAIGFTCRMNYKGNVRPLLEWSVGGNKWNGTQGTESGVASSALTLAATSRLDGANVTCEAVIKDNSPESTYSEVLWTSDTIRVKYAVLMNEGVDGCPGVETVLHCNPSCSYKLETVNGTKRCAIRYSAGTDAGRFYSYVYQDNENSPETGSGYSIAMTTLAAVSCFVLITLAIGYVINKLRFRRNIKNKNVENEPLKKDRKQRTEGGNV